MQKMNKTLKITMVLIVLVVFWVFYIALKFTYGSPDNANLSYIPTNVNSVLAINGNSTLKSVFSDFLSSQDQQLLEKLNDSKEELKQSTGIELLSDFILFKMDNKGSEVTGLLVNLVNEKDFKTSYENQVLASNSAVGLILFSDKPEVNKSQLKRLATQLLSKKTKVYTKNLSKTRGAESILSFWSRSDLSKAWNCVNVNINGAVITFKGTAFLKTDTNDGYQLKSNDRSFHVTGSGIIPSAFSDSLINYLQIDDNEISAISTNYRSLKIEQENSFEIVPDADFIFQFVRPIEIVDLLAKGQEDSTITRLSPNSYNYGGKQFYFEQLTPNSFFLGRTNNSPFEHKSSSTLLSIHGAPLYLSKIEGNSFMLRLINIFPAYRIGKALSTSIKMIDIDVTKTTADNVTVNGEIHFQKGKFASIELIRNLLELR